MQFKEHTHNVLGFCEAYLVRKHFVYEGYIQALEQVGSSARDDGTDRRLQS